MSCQQRLQPGLKISLQLRKINRNCSNRYRRVTHQKKYRQPQKVANEQGAIGLTNKLSKMPFFCSATLISSTTIARARFQQLDRHHDDGE